MSDREVQSERDADRHQDLDQGAENHEQPGPLVAHSGLDRNEARREGLGLTSTQGGHISPR
jgi:hypothetical protein